MAGVEKAWSAGRSPCGLLGAAILWVDDAERTRELANWIGKLTIAIVIWLVAFPLGETIFPRRARR